MIIKGALQKPLVNLPTFPVNQSSQNSDFGQMLMDVLNEVNAAQGESRAKQTAFMTGQPVDIHDVMIAMEKASVSLQLTMQVRNKLLESYQEIMRTQL